MKRFLLRTLFALVASAAVLIVMIRSKVACITSRQLTITAIAETHYRIYLFAAANGSLPEKLADLPNREEYANRTIDAWGRDLIYDINESGIISIGSLGRDGRIGGTDDDADIFRNINHWMIQGDLSLVTIIGSLTAKYVN